MTMRPAGPLTHLAILASAGTGKTHALAHRYIGLLGRGVDADRICALTFSRKAATEIFDSIVAALVKAAHSPQSARTTGKLAGLDGMTQADTIGLLRNLVTRLHRVQIGTLDSFIVSVLRAFSAELGVPSDFTLLNGGSVEARQLTQESLAFLLAPSRTHAEHRETFFNAFKLATYGREEKGFSDTFFDTLESCLGLYRRHPDPAIWGEPKRIWKRGGWLADNQDLAKALQRVREFTCKSEDVRVTLIECMETAAAFQPFKAWNTKCFDGTIMKRLFELMSSLKDGCSFDFKRQAIVIDPETGKAIHLILSHLVRQELVRALQQTQGLGSMLHQFHALYDETIRRRGAFTFNDAQYLLTPRNPLSAGPISRMAGEADRLYIDFRLDSRLDHWLLDEFQDTSDLQWETLDNLADEIIQDAGGDRSFFLVGDVKQAIHGWRGGNAKLFTDLLDRYGAGIKQETLSESYRSTKPVLSFVNRLFSDLDGMDIPVDAVANWKKLWKPHVSRVDKPGCAAWVEPIGEPGEGLEDDSVYTATAGLIRELNPVARGLTTAVLLPTNAECTKAADALRHALAADHIPVVNEGAAGLADNPVVALMRSLLKTAGHPGDTLAYIHLRMSPLRKQIDEAGDRLPLLLLEQIQNEGFAALIRAWAERLEMAAGPLDAFGAKRLRDLLSLAATADAAGIRDPDELIAQIETEELREQTAGGAVRIMTIHQSKGLGFDAVLVPLLQDKDLRGVGQLDLVSGLTDDQDWILKMPRQVICKADPVLSKRFDQAASENTFANLCVLYVAMTRAKQGLYAITGYGRKKRPSGRSLSGGIFMSRRLLETDKPEGVEGVRRMAGGVPLRVLVEEGDWDWPASVPAADPPKETARLEKAFPARPGALPRLSRVEPSRGGEEARQADWLFKPESRGVLDFGSLIHGYLAAVEWAGEADVDAILRAVKPDHPVDDSVRADVEAQFRRMMAAPEVRTVLARPTGAVTLWREMRFELVDGTAWISGAFDRVTVFRDADGKPVRAHLMDFKSSRIKTDADMAETAENYRHQLTLYRRALSRILKIGEAAIDMQILFTRVAKIFVLPR